MPARLQSQLGEEEAAQENDYMADGGRGVCEQGGV